MATQTRRRILAILFAAVLAVPALPVLGISQSNEKQLPAVDCGGEWHWVHNKTDASTGTLTVVFVGLEAITVTNADSPSANLHYYIDMAGPATLLSASDDVTGGRLQLSHWPECPASDGSATTDDATDTSGSDTGQDVAQSNDSDGSDSEDTGGSTDQGDSSEQDDQSQSGDSEDGDDQDDEGDDQETESTGDENQLSDEQTDGGTPTALPSDNRDTSDQTPDAEETPAEIVPDPAPQDQQPDPQQFVEPEVEVAGLVITAPPTGPTAAAVVTPPADTPAATTPATEVAASTVGSSSVVAAPATLPFTGSESTIWAALGAAIVAAGGALLLAGREPHIGRHETR